MARGDFHRWLYHGQHPNLLARILNRAWALVHATGAVSNFVTLEVRGRKTGRVSSFPLVMAVVDGQRYLVSMLGEEVAWVRNVRAGGGKAVLVHGRREEVYLVDVPTEERAPILKVYLQNAPGARPHVCVDKDAALPEFEKVAALYPVFRVAASSA